MPGELVTRSTPLPPLGVDFCLIHCLRLFEGFWVRHRPSLRLLPALLGRNFNRDSGVLDAVTWCSILRRAARGDAVLLIDRWPSRSLFHARLAQEVRAGSPEPVIPESLYWVVRRCPMRSTTVDATDSVNVERDLASIAYRSDVLLLQLPPCVYILLSHVLHLMHDVSLRAASNRMDASNLAHHVRIPVYEGRFKHFKAEDVIDNLPAHLELYEGEIPEGSLAVVGYTVTQYTAKGNKLSVGMNLQYVIVLGEPKDE
ncbi:hypothetical protein DFH06DRAFT_1401235 [Mycena polygramma]|nr:hypothetical protein DFH06DRAFT_1401235 [Mycena polygramma]